MKTYDDLLQVVYALIDLALSVTDDVVLVENCVRSVGCDDDDLRNLGFDVDGNAR